MTALISGGLRLGAKRLGSLLLVLMCLFVLFSVSNPQVYAQHLSPDNIYPGNLGEISNSTINSQKPPAYFVFMPLIITANPAPSSFSKYAPPNGTIGGSLAPVLSWVTADNATRYECCYDTTNDGKCSNWIPTGSNTYAGVSGLKAGTTYYWQVRAWNGIIGPTYANGSAGAYWSYTTESLHPGGFSKNAPANGSVNLALNPILSWNSSTNATKYEYCYDTTNDGACSNWTSTGTNTYAGLYGLQPGTTYYWQVRSWNGTYGPTYADGGATSHWNFTTLASQDPILNGNFELGNTGWFEFSSNNFYLILNTTQDLPVQPRNGSWLAWLGGWENETAGLFQTITIPPGRSVLHYWVWTASADYCGYDDFGIVVNDDVVYAQWVCYQNDTDGWVHRTIDLSTYVNQTVDIAFIAELDGSNNSNIFLDDISLQPTASLNATIEDFTVGSGSHIETKRDLHQFDTTLTEGKSLNNNFFTDILSSKVRLIKEHLLDQ